VLTQSLVTAAHLAGYLWRCDDLGGPFDDHGNVLMVVTLGDHHGEPWRATPIPFPDRAGVLLGQEVSRPRPNQGPTLRREALCYIPGSAGRKLEDIPGSDGLPGSER
jgi:hypothetical protein